MFLSLLHVNVGNDPDRDQPGRRWLRDIYRVHQRLWMAFPDPKRREEDPFFLSAWDGPPIPEPKPTRRESGFLFRIERDGLPRILVQSAQQPYWDYAFQNAPYLLANEPQLRPKVRTYDPAPSRDCTYRFRLLANVVNRRSIAYSDGRTRQTRGRGLTISRRRRAETIIHPGPLPDPLPADPAERKKVLQTRWEPWLNWMVGIGGKNGFRIVNTDESPLFMEAVHVSIRRPAKVGAADHHDKPAPKIFNAGLFEGLLVCTDPQDLRKAMIRGIGSAKAFGFGLLSVAPISS